jgi:hypothetical protein
VRWLSLHKAFARDRFIGNLSYGYQYSGDRRERDFDLAQNTAVHANELRHGESDLAFDLGASETVQVRIAELRSRSWPHPSVDDLVAPSGAVSAAKQLSRRLRTDPLFEVAEFLTGGLLTVLWTES